MPDRTLNAFNSGSGTPLNTYGAALPPVTSPTRGTALGEPPVTEDEVYGDALRYLRYNKVVASTRSFE